jgi:exoribonuclease II
MESGSVIEYIDHQKITCAVVLEVKNHRLRLLTESNREVNLSAGRLSHVHGIRLDMSIGRDKLVEKLKETSLRCNALTRLINIKELWEVLNTEQEWIDLETMTEFCFPDNPTSDHASAVLRAFFENRRYFKFKPDGFFPFTEEQVEKIIAQAEAEAKRNRIIETGSEWLIRSLNAPDRQKPGELSGEFSEIIDILRFTYLFGKDSPHYQLGKSIMGRAGITNDSDLFQIFVKLGIMDENENIDLLRSQIPVEFNENTLVNATDMIEQSRKSGMTLFGNHRKDLTSLPLFTIDGQATLDFDDAISLEENGDHFRLGIHIADVGYFIKKGDAIDQEAFSRGSSIYMPDQKIPMLPSCLAEDLCSLKQGQFRPAISIMADITAAADVIDYEIFASLIKVSDQLTYYDVNLVAENHHDFSILYKIAKKFRLKRLADSAIQISLPDINVWIDNSGEVNVSRINRESPGRMLVAEIMILANWLMAKFLAKHQVPAIYRSQPKPKDRLYKGDEGTLFQNCMQRKLLSRFVLGSEPEAHSGLGLEAYTTATSPIRKYFDLVSQRQLRAILGLESFYTKEEIEHIIHMLEQPMSKVTKLQYGRNRYWILKYLEKKIGQKEEAIVLYKRKNNYAVLIPAYMIECDLPLSAGIGLSPEDLVQITIQHVNARKNTLSIFMG